MSEMLDIVITKRTESLDDYYPDGGSATVYTAQYGGRSAVGLTESNAVSRLIENLLFLEEITERVALNTLLYYTAR